MIFAALAIALVLNPDVTQANIKQTVCTPDWTATIRPKPEYTDALKRQQLPAGEDPSKYEEDHYTPLCLGGHPRDPHNLRPQIWPDARKKDTEERTLCRAVCKGKISLDDAQQKLANDWPIK